MERHAFVNDMKLVIQRLKGIYIIKLKMLHKLFVFEEYTL